MDPGCFNINNKHAEYVAQWEQLSTLKLMAYTGSRL